MKSTKEFLELIKLELLFCGKICGSFVRVNDGVKEYVGIVGNTCNDNSIYVNTLFNNHVGSLFNMSRLKKVTLYKGVEKIDMVNIDEIYDFKNLFYTFINNEKDENIKNALKRCILDIDRVIKNIKKSNKDIMHIGYRRYPNEKRNLFKLFFSVKRTNNGKNEFDFYSLISSPRKVNKENIRNIKYTPKQSRSIPFSEKKLVIRPKKIDKPKTSELLSPHINNTKLLIEKRKNMRSKSRNLTIEMKTPPVNRISRKVTIKDIRKMSKNIETEDLETIKNKLKHIRQNNTRKRWTNTLCTHK